MIISQLGLLYLYGNFMMKSSSQKYYWFEVQLYWYSIWGLGGSVISQTLSNIAACTDGWYNVALFACEMSVAVNIQVVLCFWLLLLPGLFKAWLASGDLAYECTLHFVPALCNVLNIAFTDMTLRKSNWHWAVFFFCPIYMCIECFGSYRYNR